MSPGDIIVLALVAVAILTAIVLTVRNYRSGKCSCGCDRCCGRCHNRVEMEDKRN